MKQLLLAAVFFGGAAGAEAAPPAFPWKGDVSFAAYSGDYGTTEETDTTILQFKGTRYFSAGDLWLAIPYIGVTGRSAVVVGGGKPVPGQPKPGLTETTSNSGLGDMVVGAHTIFLPEVDYSVEVGGTAFVKIPTANEEEGLGTGEFDEGLRLELYKTLPRDYFGILDLGYTVVGDIEGFKYDDRWLVSFGAGRMFTEKISGALIFTGETGIVEGEENARDLTLSVNAALTAAASMDGGLLIGLADGSPDSGLFLGGQIRF